MNETYEKITCLFVAVGMTALVTPFSAMAVENSIVPGDTFSFNLEGYDNQDNAEMLTPVETATFGTTETFAGLAPSGQDLTITSEQYIHRGMVFDYLAISSPTNFLPADSVVDGETINGIQFNIGNTYKGNTTSGNFLDYVLPLQGFSTTSGFTFGTTTTGGGYPADLLEDGGKSLIIDSGVHIGDGSPLGDYDPEGLSTTISFPVEYLLPSIPEPSAAALSGLGLLGCGLVAFYRRRRDGDGGRD